MKPKNIKVKDFDKKQEDKKEDINKKIDTLTDDIKDREEVKEKTLLPQKNINRNYKNAKNKLKNKKIIEGGKKIK